MPEIPSSLRIAVLIDCDNVSPSYAPLILEELASHGTPTIKRAYGDWTTTNLNGWKKALNHHAIQPVQQFAYTVGKNSTDSTLIIDAMDLLWMGNVDAFALVSSDSDFTRLATRLRESGKRVIGLGQRKTPASLRNAVDQFVYLELLKASAEEHDDAAAGHDADAEESAGEDEAQPGQGSSRSSRGGRGRRRGGRGSKSAGAETPAEDTHAEESTTDAQPASTPELAEAEEQETTEEAPRIHLESALVKAINATSGDDGWASLGVIGQHLSRTHVDFDPRDFGFRKLSDLVEDQSYLQTRTEGRTVEAAVKARRRRRAEG